MQRDEWGGPAPREGVGGGRDREAPGRSALAGYVAQLDRIVGEAREPSWLEAARALARVPAPEGLLVGHVVERKRRELLGRFDRMRTRHVRVDVADRPAWLRGLQACAELAGCTELLLTGAGEARRCLLQAGRSWQPHAPEPAAGLTGAGFAAPSDRGEAYLDLVTGWLTLAGPPMFVREALRNLDRLDCQLPLDVHVPWDPRRDWLEGSPQGMRVQLTNLSQDILVVAEVGSPEPGALAEHLRRSSLGRLRHVEAEGCYEYEPAAPGVTAPVFHCVVLRPGQSRTVVWNLPAGEAGDGWRRFEVTLARLSPAQFATHAYMPAPRTGFGVPASIRYVRPTPDLQEEPGDWTSVLLPDAGRLPWQRSAWQLPVFVQPRAFSAAQARTLVSPELTPIHYSRWQQAWVLADGAGSVLAWQDRIERQPRVDPACYVVVDSQDQRLALQISGRALPQAREALVAVQDWASHGLGLPVHLPRAALPSLWRLAERHGLQLGVARDVLGRAILHLDP
ncbi:MAG: hypothetical protein VKS61_08095 [Candidatus Sericytochromatia bacterium]|nr:hypothetical protein [Candidatus Sericytochromatia bacterium]